MTSIQRANSKNGQFPKAAPNLADLEERFNQLPQMYRGKWRTWFNTTLRLYALSTTKAEREDIREEVEAFLTARERT
jgi:hypothetical protein